MPMRQLRILQNLQKLEVRMPCKLTPEKQTIAQYAVLHGNKAAILHFSQELGFGIKESSVNTWKSKYQAEPKCVSATESIDDVSVKGQLDKRRGRPLLLGEKLDPEVKSYIHAVCKAGAVITTAITIAALTAIVRRSDRNILSEDGCPTIPSTNLLFNLYTFERK